MSADLFLTRPSACRPQGNGMTPLLRLRCFRTQDPPEIQCQTISAGGTRVEKEKPKFKAAGAARGACELAELLRMKPETVQPAQPRNHNRWRRRGPQRFPRSWVRSGQRRAGSGPEAKGWGATGSCPAHLSQRDSQLETAADAGTGLPD